MSRPPLLKADLVLVRQALNRLAEAHAEVNQAKDTLSLRHALARLRSAAIDLDQLSIDAERRAGKPELQRHEHKVLELDS